MEYGAADIGVVGKDTILEEGRNLYEVMDLGIGKCRMCVAGPASARERLKHHELIRVASKYPVIAKDYFYNKKHQTYILYHKVLCFYDLSIICLLKNIYLAFCHLAALHAY